jgi:gluconolactonase
LFGSFPFFLGSPRMLSRVAVVFLLARYSHGFFLQASREAATSPEIKILTDDGTALLEGAQVALVGTEGQFQFNEAPVWVPRLNQWLFQDIGNGNGVTHSFDPASGDLDIWIEDSKKGNGLIMDKDGKLLTCEMNPARVIRRDVLTKESEVIASSFEGSQLNSPNDIVESKEGRIYFTDPDYGGVVSQEHNNVFMYDPATDRLLAVDATFTRPNGIALSPDGKLLYVSDTGAIVPDAELDYSLPHEVFVLDVGQDGTLTNKRSFHVVPDGEGAPDGMRVDPFGNLWSSSFMGVQVFLPNGTMIAKIDTPTTVTNLAFGGSSGGDVMLTASDTVWLVSTNAKLTTSSAMRRQTYAWAMSSISLFLGLASFAC